MSKKKSRGYTPHIQKKMSNGYVLIKIGQSWMSEHRLVVEDKIGRYLTDEEVIHHIDGNKKNNSVDNLMLFKTQKEHASFHKKITQFGMTNPVKRQIKNRWDEFK